MTDTQEPTPIQEDEPRKVIDEAQMVHIEKGPRFTRPWIQFEHIRVVTLLGIGMAFYFVATL